MNKKGRFIRAAAVSLAAAISVPSAAFAAEFKDVPKTFWAYNAIEEITSQGLMVGDFSGNFNPDSYIDKFDTSRILAKVLGYNYGSATQQDNEYYENLYQEKKSFIDQYAKAFTKWNSSSDREIAFLLDKGVLKNEDLNQFVIRSTEGKEQLRALSREEFAVFLVRMMGKTDEAAKYQITDKFSDDASINSAKRQSVYYLKSLGIISGTTDNKFNPNGAVTRADFCVLLNNTLKYMGKTISADTTASSSAGDSGSVVNNIETVSGSLDKYFPSLNVIQLSVGTTQKLYKVTSGAAVKIDGFNGSLSELKEGMTITALLNNSEVVQIDASSSLPQTTETIQPVQPTQTVQAAESPQQIETQTQSASASGSITATISEDDLTMIVGSVESVNESSITLSYRMVNSRDEINTQSKTYTFADNAVLTRNSSAITAADISTDDIASAKILGSKVYYLDVEGGSLVLNNGTLVKKYYNSSKNMPALVIETNDGKSYELYVTEDSKIARNTEDETPWNDLKVGDKVSFRTNLNKIESLEATGESRSLEGYVTSVRMESDGSYIGVSENENGTDAKLYPVDINSVDLYSVRVGDKVKMYLESDEVSTVNVRKSGGSNTVTGYVTSVKSTYILIEAYEDASSSRKKIKVDSDTAVLSSVTGKKIKVSALDEDMKVYVVLDDDDSSLAKTITVLSNN